MLQALERRRAESTRAMLLAPLLALLAQPFLLIALGDENVGWLGRLAVLAAAWTALLAAAWTVLRSRAREAQYETALEFAGVGGLRPERLERPRHHRRSEPPAPGATALDVPRPPRREPATPALESVSPPPGETAEEPLPGEPGEEPLPEKAPLRDAEPLTPLTDAEPQTPPPDGEEAPLSEETGESTPAADEAETEVFGAEGETELIEEPPPEAGPAEEIEEGEPQEELPRAAKREREPWVRRWDHHVVWWASGSEHARPYMAWIAAIGLFALADLAVLLATI
jgi:hypothetical protein